MKRYYRFVAIVVIIVFILSIIIPLILQYAFAANEFVYAPYELKVPQQNGIYQIEKSSDGIITIYLSWKFDGTKNDIDYFELYIGESSDNVNQKMFIYTYDPYLQYDPENKIFKYKMIMLPNSQRFKSGFIYYVRIRAAKVTVLPNNQGTIISYSAFSNLLSFLTPIAVQATTVSETSIEIVWDDVYYNNERINYDILVSKDLSFSTSTKFQIDADKITLLQNQPLGGRVEILPNKKLKYVATNLIPSSVYYVKVQPRGLSTEVIYRFPNNLDIAETTTYIQAEAVRISQDIVRLRWILASNASDRNYEIYKGGQNQVPVLVGLVSGSNNEFYITVGINEQVFFKIQVDVIDAYGKTVTIRSRELYIFPQTIPYSPPAAEELTAMPVDQTKISLKFKIPNDTNVVYDIYYKRITDSDEAYTLAISDYKMLDSDVVKDQNGNPTNYYSVVISNLSVNTVYVFKVVVKKAFFDFDLNRYFYKESYPSLAVSYTLSGQIAPPSVITSVYVDTYTDTTITIKWLPELIQNTSIIDKSISYVVNVVYYTYGMDLSNPDNITVDFSQVIQNPQLDFDNKVKYTITNLLPNTRYIIFLKSFRVIGNIPIYSSASNVVMVTTQPKSVVLIPTKPPLIENLSVVSVAYDNIRLSFDYYDNTYYEIQINENIENANGWKIIESSFIPAITDLNTSFTICYYTVRNLNPDTGYFFRVRSYVIKDNQKIYSDFSNTVYGKTTKIPPPKTPIAFGIKEIGIDYAAFIWEKAEDSRNYVLEIADNSNFIQSTKINIGLDQTSYKVSGLKTNTKYYVRLFAVGNDRQYSDPTYTIVFTTKRDVYEYVDYVDTTMQNRTKEIEVYEDVYNFEMVVEITYKLANTNLNGEKIEIDFTKRINGSLNKFTLKIRADVLNTLSYLSKDIILYIDGFKIYIPYNTVNTDNLPFQLGEELYKTYIILQFEKDKTKISSIKGLVSDIYNINYFLLDNNFKRSINFFNKKIDISAQFQVDENVYPFVYDRIAGEWNRISYSYTKAYKSISFELDSPNTFTLVKFSGYKDLVLSTYAANLIYLFNTFPCDDNSEYLGINQAVTKHELASYLVYYAVNRRLGTFQKNNQLVQKALKAQLIDDISERYITREEAIDMLVKFYEAINGERISFSDSITIEVKNGDERYLNSIKKAWSKKWLYETNSFDSKAIANRDYVLAVLYRILKEVR